MKASHDASIPQSSKLKEIVMHVEYHNGWKAVSQKVLTLKEKESDPQMSTIMAVSKLAFETKSTIKKTSYKSMKETAVKTGFEIYYFEGMKELNIVFLEEGGACLFWLEAKVEVKFDVQTS